MTIGKNVQLKPENGLSVKERKLRILNVVEKMQRKVEAANMEKLAPETKPEVSDVELEKKEAREERFQENIGNYR